MTELKVHVKSEHAKDYTPCGIHTDRISNYPPYITCLRCRTKPEFHRLVKWYENNEKERREREAKKKKDLEVGLQIYLAKGDRPSVGFYTSDIAQINLSEKYISVNTKDGVNIYPLLHVVGISMSLFIYENRYREQ